MMGKSLARFGLGVAVISTAYWLPECLVPVFVATILAVAWVES
jgi:hypothetical protein